MSPEHVPRAGQSPSITSEHLHHDQSLTTEGDKVYLNSYQGWVAFLEVMFVWAKGLLSWWKE